MNLIFNELSAHHKAGSRFEAQDLMKKLLLTCKNARMSNFTHLRINKSFSQLRLFEDYTVSNWLNDQSVRKDYKGLLLGLKRYPFIDEADEDIEGRFIQNSYYLNAPQIQELHMQEAEGLAAAFLYNTISISLATHEVWGEINIELLEKTEERENGVSVRHVSYPEHIESHREWIESNRPVELIETDILPEKKMIKLRDDHGKDVLNKIAKRLIKSSYVVKIINSLPFNSTEKNFIRRVYPDGKIEIVLTRTNQGYGLIVQTTGRNLQETRKIAGIIKAEFGVWISIAISK